jgi:hypothetical protein
MPIKGACVDNFKLTQAQVAAALAKQTRGVQGKCLECEDGTMVLNFPEEFYQKYGGQLREVLTLEPCKCGSHLWMIKIPSRLNMMDNVLGEEDDDTRTS